ncbi:MAG TPA: DEAD/DEAH box helicase [Actinocrinis sp.]|nr:DEAD/DEAH box helicase [Actinocrinis sp.]
MTATRAARRQSTSTAAGTSSVAASSTASASSAVSTPRAAAASSTTPASSSSFATLGLPAALVKALAAAGISEPFPIQAATLPDTLAGRDVLGRGRTGSGKTLAFVLPVLARLAANPAPRRPGRPRALILAPTRELATQIHDTLEPLARRLGLRSTTVFGGVGAGPQISALRAGLDVLVACPGRLEDHLTSRRAWLDAVEITVLDEADHMADLGFLPTVKRLLDLTPGDGQRLLFSATLDRGVDQLVQRYLHAPVTHSVDSERSPVATMTHHVLHIEPEHRLALVVDLAAAPGRTIVFTRTKHGARKLARQLAAARIPAVELHGNLAHNARARNLAAFASGEASTLVATDIAARGIHVDDVALVVHADPPVEHKAYLHRSGRTARAGASGTVVTLMTDAQRKEVGELTRKAGIKATTTRLAPGDPLLERLAPGQRTFAGPLEAADAGSPAGQPGQRGQRQGRSRNQGAAKPFGQAAKAAGQSAKTAGTDSTSGRTAARQTAGKTSERQRRANVPGQRRSTDRAARRSS